MFLFNLQNHNYSHVHFIGIGGISMSALAEILLHNGYHVSGSDMKASSMTHKLKAKGADIFIGHDASNISGADLIVYTSAVHTSNPELKAAELQNVPAVDRATFLGALMKDYKSAIAVAGTHGKTTTTSMIATIFTESLVDATMLVGGELDVIGGNVKIGSKDYFLTEACEYKGNFLKFSPTIGIILNVEEDHLDYFKNLDHIIDTFKKFTERISKDGYLIINRDDPSFLTISDNCKGTVITFGMDHECNYKATNIHFNALGLPTFDLVTHEGTYPVTLNVVGVHNIYNALSAIAATHQAGLPIEKIVKGISKYRGTHRRFEQKGVVSGIKVIDDYAHHPTEILTTLDSASRLVNRSIWCVFQPHTYTRTKTLLKDFATAFYKADHVIITDIYAAREPDTGLVHAKDLQKLLQQNGVDSQYIGPFDDIVDYLKDHVKKNDLLLTMGAGDVYEIGEKFLQSIQQP